MRLSPVIEGFLNVHYQNGKAWNSVCSIYEGRKHKLTDNSIIILQKKEGGAAGSGSGGPTQRQARVCGQPEEGKPPLRVSRSLALWERKAARGELREEGRAVARACGMNNALTQVLEKMLEASEERLDELTQQQEEVADKIFEEVKYINFEFQKCTCMVFHFLWEMSLGILRVRQHGLLPDAVRPVRAGGARRGHADLGLGLL